MPDYSNPADFVALHPGWEFQMRYAGEVSTAEAPLVVLAGPSTPPGTKCHVWDRTIQHPWYIPIPPA